MKKNGMQREKSPMRQAIDAALAKGASTYGSKDDPRMLLSDLQLGVEMVQVIRPVPNTTCLTSWSHCRHHFTSLGSSTGSGKHRLRLSPIFVGHATAVQRQTRSKRRFLTKVLSATGVGNSENVCIGSRLKPIAM